MDIDRQVAEQVMGWHFGKPDYMSTTNLYMNEGWHDKDEKFMYSLQDFRPSDFIAYVWLVVEKLREVGWQLELDVQEGAYFVPVAVRNRANTRAFCTAVFTYPEAISRAALEVMNDAKE